MEHTFEQNLPVQFRPFNDVRQYPPIPSVDPSVNPSFHSTEIRPFNSVRKLRPSISAYSVRRSVR